MTHSGKAILVAAALVVLVGACGSSSSSKASTGGGGLQNTPGGSTANKGGSSGGSSSGNSSGNSSLTDLIAKGKTADIKITYKVSGSAAAGSDNTTFTLIQRGKDSVDQFGDSTVYDIGGKTTTCTGTGSSASCESISGLGNTGALTGSLFTTYDQVLQNKALAPYLGSLKQSSQTIAGRSAKCISISGAAATGLGGSGTVCIDNKTGILLSAQGTSSGSTGGIVATSVGSPSDADFTLPATPKTISVPSYSIPSTP